MDIKVGKLGKNNLQIILVFTELDGYCIRFKVSKTKDIPVSIVTGMSLISDGNLLSDAHLPSKIDHLTRSRRLF